MASVLKTEGGDEPSVGSNPTAPAITFNVLQILVRTVTTSFLREAGRIKLNKDACSET